MFGRKTLTQQSLTSHVNTVRGNSSVKDSERQQSRFELIHTEVMLTIEPAVVVQLSREELETRTFEAVGTLRCAINCLWEDKNKNK